ncbi:MAG: histidine kinase, partial [Spirochaetia bacterium]
EDEEHCQYILKLSNTGNPFPEEIGPENPKKLGLQLVSTLVAQLNGTLELQKRPEPVFIIHFPMEIK